MYSLAFLIYHQILCLSKLLESLRDHRITHGQDAKLGQFPSFVSIFLYENQAYICGGMLATLHLVLTAAHCTHRVTNPYNIRFKPSELFVLAGAVDHDNVGDCVQNRSVNHIIVHHWYRHVVRGYDLAFLSLTSKFEESPCISTGYIYKKSVPIGSKMQIVGFGRTKKYSRFSRKLQWAVGYSYNLKTCGYDGYLKSGLYCIRGRRKPYSSTMPGDSGGPIYYQGMVVGIHSMGKINSNGEGGLSTKLTAYQSFVEEVIDGTYLSKAASVHNDLIFIVIAMEFVCL